jgi:hypothetical protein
MSRTFAWHRHLGGHWLAIGFCLKRLSTRVVRVIAKDVLCRFCHFFACARTGIVPWRFGIDLTASSSSPAKAKWVLRGARAIASMVS